MSLLTVGSVAFDDIETPFGSSDKILGGAAPFISLSASYIPNTQPKVVSVIGDDFPEEYLTMLQSKGIDTAGIERVAGGKTFYWKGKYRDDMNQRDTLDTQLNVLADFSPELSEDYKSCEFVMLGNLHPLVQIKVVEQLKNPKLIALDTMNFWMNETWDELMQVIRMVQVIIINDEEARQLTEETSLKLAAKKIMKMGPEVVVIKKGEHGALLFTQEGKIFSAPAYPLEEVFDPTGAGDTFAGGFMGYLASKGDTSWEAMKQAVIMGSCMASFCVEKFGTQRLQELNNEEVFHRLDAFQDMTTYNPNF